MRNIRWALLAAFVLVAPAQAAKAPVPSVVVTRVTQQNIAPVFSNIGHVTAIQTVKIVPRVTAFIDRVNFKQGSDVKEGQVLFTLQKAQYEAALQTAAASVASAKAALENAQLTYSRAVSLGARGFESQSSLDAALATRDEDQANVMSAQANLANAQLNLSYCTILAPISGRIGAVALTKGNLVTANSGTLATINQLDPIRVVFSVSSDSPILAAAQSGPTESQFTLGLELPSGKPYPLKGKIAFLDNQVTTNTGTVNIYADFANPNGLLLPGAYVNVDTAPAQATEALLVPVSAVQTDQHGQFVLTVGPDHKVHQEIVTLGEQIAQNFIVKFGLKLGDQVIVDGTQKVKVGDTVTTTTAPAESASAPGDSQSQ